MANSFPHLFSPIKIGSMQVKNRVALAPMANYMSNDEGTMTEPQIAFLERRAKGGTGLLILGSLCVDMPVGRFGSGQLGMHDDALIPRYRDMTDAVHAHGAKIAGQLHHAGRGTTRAGIRGMQPVAPSPIALNITKYLDAPRELSIAEIQQIVQKFGDAAARSKEAGFDAIEIHMAHGYLPCQFMSPYHNKRSDEYGGDVYGRTRFPREILKAVRAAVGPDMPLWCRIVGDELQGDEGLQIEDMKVIAGILIEAGAQAISVSRGMAPYYKNVMNYRFEQGCMVDLAEAIKSTVTVPVFTAGRIFDPQFAEGVLSEGRADIINMARALVADPDWANKAAAGAVEDICPCVYCNLGCHDPKRKVRHTLCLANTECGREGHLDLNPAASPKKVLVVGGGPAGLEAARVAQQRGHQVTLVEQKDYLGGQLHLGTVAPYKSDMKRLIDWWTLAATKAGVQIQTGKTVTAEDVREMAPDAVVVATGGKPAIPPVPGVERSFVVTAHDVLGGQADVGEHVVVLGGGQTGAETAEVLALAGKKVTVIEMLEDIGLNVPPDEQFWTKESLAELGVRVLVATEVTEIGERQVTFTRMSEGIRWSSTLEDVDNVVLAAGVVSVVGLATQIADLVPNVYVIGDASTPSNALDATQQAANVAREI